MPATTQLAGQVSQRPSATGLKGHPTTSTRGQPLTPRRDLPGAAQSPSQPRNRPLGTATGACATPTASPYRTPADPPTPPPDRRQTTTTRRTPNTDGLAVRRRTCTRNNPTAPSTPSTSTSPNPTTIPFTRLRSQSTPILQSSALQTAPILGKSLTLKRGYPPTPPRPHSRRAGFLWAQLQGCRGSRRTPRARRRGGRGRTSVGLPRIVRVSGTAITRSSTRDGHVTGHHQTGATTEFFVLAPPHLPTTGDSSPRLLENRVAHQRPRGTQLIDQAEPRVIDTRTNGPAARSSSSAVIDLRPLR